MAYDEREAGELLELFDQVVDGLVDLAVEAGADRERLEELIRRGNGQLKARVRVIFVRIGIVPPEEANGP